MNRPIVALCMLLALIMGCFWSDAVIENEVAAIIVTGQSNAWDAAYEKWQQSQPLFGALLPHQALDDVDRLFVRVIQAQQSEQTDALVLSRAELLLLLQTLPTFDDINFRNVF